MVMSVISKIFGLGGPPAPTSKHYEPVETFKFHAPLPDDDVTTNGLCFSGHYLPEEVVFMIMSHVEVTDILNCALVCRKWCNIVKSQALWVQIYTRRYNKKPKKLPWYVFYCLFGTQYFDRNLLKNGNGQEQFKYWRIVQNYGDEFRIEDPPKGADCLPQGVADFGGRTSCFATSFYECNKVQEISWKNSRLMTLVMSRFKPHVYLSEWVAGRFDCGCIYKLWGKLCRQSQNDSNDEDIHVIHAQQLQVKIEQWAGKEWEKVELILKDYPSGATSIIFQHEGRDTQFWKGHYGSKMAGGVVKILFDSIERIDK